MNQHRSVLENDGFIEWANENILVVVGHTQEDHPTEYEDDRGKKQEGCPLYRGMTCEEHRAITGECMRPAEGLPEVKSTGRMPNTWLVSPSGDVTQVPAADQQSAGKIEDLVSEALEESGKHLTWKKYEDYREEFTEFDQALEAGEFKDAFKVLKKFEKDAKKLPDGMNAEIDKRVGAIDTKVRETLEELKGGEDVKAAIKAASKLRYAVGSRLKRGYLPIVDEIKDWVKEAKAASK